MINISSDGNKTREIEDGLRLIWVERERERNIARDGQREGRREIAVKLKGLGEYGILFEIFKRKFVTKAETRS